MCVCAERGWGIICALWRIYMGMCECYVVCAASTSPLRNGGRRSCTLMWRCGCCHCDFTLNKSFLSLEMKTYLICSIQKDESEEQSWVGLSWLLVIPKLLCHFWSVHHIVLCCGPVYHAATFRCLSFYSVELVQIERTALPCGETTETELTMNMHTHTHTHALQLIQLMAYS